MTPADTSPIEGLKACPLCSSPMVIKGHPLVGAPKYICHPNTMGEQCVLRGLIVPVERTNDWNRRPSPDAELLGALKERLTTLAANHLALSNAKGPVWQRKAHGHAYAGVLESIRELDAIARAEALPK